MATAVAKKPRVKCMGKAWINCETGEWWTCSENLDAETVADLFVSDAVPLEQWGEPKTFGICWICETTYDGERSCGCPEPFTRFEREKKDA